MYRLPGLVGRIIARQRRANAAAEVRSVEDMRAALVAAGVKVSKRWGAKRLAEEIAKLK